MAHRVEGPRLGGFLRALSDALQEMVFPSRCGACGAPGEVWCQPCRRRLVRAEGVVCLGCGRVTFPSEARHTCPRRVPRAVAAARYQAPVDRLLTFLKYRPDPRLVTALAGCLCAAVEGSGFRTTCVVPVPLGARRLRQRGYNQAELLGRALARSMQLPFYPSAAVRLRETASQVGLDPMQRQANVAGAFRGDPDWVGGHSVLLVDDVHTTGATLAACADALLQAGAVRVLGATVGRV